MSLKDTHERTHDYLRISLTEKCNLRCQYCMPAEGVPLSPTQLTAGEIGRLATIFKDLGVKKVKLTGGEPAVRNDIVQITQQMSALFSEVGITTNGTLMKRKLPKLKDVGLTNVNISLDSLVEAKNQFITRRPNTTEAALNTIDQCIELGLRTKLNVVSMKNFNEEEVCDFVELTRDRDLAVRFIEFMPFGSNSWNDDKFVPSQTLMNLVQAKYPGVTRLTDDNNSTSRNW